MLLAECTYYVGTTVHTKLRRIDNASDENEEGGYSVYGELRNIWNHSGKTSYKAGNDRNP
jgi:hypothetical protein